MPDYGKIIFNDQAPVADYAQYLAGKVLQRDKIINYKEIVSEANRIKFDGLIQLLCKMLKYSP